MSAVNRALSRSLRTQNTYSAPRQALQSVSLLSRGAPLRASGFSRTPRSLPRTTTTSRFHTMASLQSAASATPMPSEGVGYDPEVKDIANYIHNYSINSDLAVSLLRPCSSSSVPRRRR